MDFAEMDYPKEFLDALEWNCINMFQTSLSEEETKKVFAGAEKALDGVWSHLVVDSPGISALAWQEAVFHAMLDLNYYLPDDYLPDGTF